MIFFNKNSILATLLCLLVASISGCSGKSATAQAENSISLTESQNELIDEGWHFSNTSISGELPKEYGVKNKYGQHDNYLDIEVGKGCDVALKIVDASTHKCIRYVFVPENSMTNIQMIPQGKYYLKLAYGKDWMERENEDGTICAKFTRNVCYDKSVNTYDFGKKNSDQVHNGLLKINVVDNTPQNNFPTQEISESEFMD